MEKYVELIKPVADSLGLDIIETELINKDLLEISIANKNYEPIDLDTCTRAAEAFGEALDYEIGLDVGSAGAEREIDAEDFDSLVDQYVLVQFVNPFMGADYVEGTVVSVDDQDIVISYRQKHALKEVKIERLNIKMLRLAVKL
ncbi:ribosome assembly cofactor RimP [Erysipelothrix inopinata]|uniref:Ribosome maturation factor RimP n=1 Tax=Erysipelothrix inopinata TaxID=225084 RepID=A0A7G9RXN1_9FIRM|nr:ribosome assembly cofactor RimP [Erysipelothrix inopinata]QNN60356.1 ribosome assembly cofactor RimP [Erysipelothrix inopinata]